MNSALNKWRLRGMCFQAMTHAVNYTVHVLSQASINLHPQTFQNYFTFSGNIDKYNAFKKYLFQMHIAN